MKKILIIFFISLLSFTNANISKADDISIFQIDGLSIGQSALKIFSEEEILKGNQNYYKSKKYTTVRIDSSSSGGFTRRSRALVTTARVPSLPQSNPGR